MQNVLPSLLAGFNPSGTRRAWLGLSFALANLTNYCLFSVMLYEQFATTSLFRGIMILVGLSVNLCNQMIVCVCAFFSPLSFFRTLFLSHPFSSRSSSNNRYLVLKQNDRERRSARNLLGNLNFTAVQPAHFISNVLIPQFVVERC